MTIYIEKYNGEFRCVNTYSAWYGFDSLGAEIKFFSEPLLKDQPLTKEDVVVGSIRVVHNALKQLGVEIPPPLDYPKSIESFLHRKIFKTTFGEMRGYNKQCFVKPVQHKLFTGQVFDTYANTESIQDDTKVWACPKVDWLSEYRCFVHKRELIGVHYYKGKFHNYINVNEVNKCIHQYVDQPVAYSLDFGYMASSMSCKTALVEVNDAYALGCYGLPPIKYAKMISDRWKEICNV